MRPRAPQTPPGDTSLWLSQGILLCPLRDGMDHDASHSPGNPGFRGCQAILYARIDIRYPAFEERADAQRVLEESMLAVL